MKWFYIITCFIVIEGIENNLWSQLNAKITGNIFDEQTNEPLYFVNVSVRNTKRGTTSNRSGYYEIKLSPGSFELIFSMMGYKTLRQQLKLTENQSLIYDVYLSPTVLYMPGLTIIASKTAQQKQNESVSSFAFETKKIMKLPFSLNDINRALKTLPGISSNNAKSSEFNVRGGSFEENLVQIDGVTIYRPFHLKEMPNASISILNMNLMKKVNLMTGGFPAKFGDKMSSVIEIEYRDGNTKNFKSQIEAGVVTTNLLIEGPLGKKCSAIIGFNKSYFQPAMRVMDRYFSDFFSGSGINGFPTFYDLQGRVNYRINNQHQIALLFLNSGDHYSEEPGYRHENYTRHFDTIYTQMKTTDKTEFKGDFSNTLLALRFRNQIRNTLYAKTTISYYDEKEDLLLESEYNVNNRYYYRDDNRYRGFSNYNNDDRYQVNLHIKTLELKTELAFKLTPYHEVETGFNFQQINYIYQLDDYSERITYHNIVNYPDTTKVDTLFYDDNYDNHVSLTSTSYKISGYLQDNWQIGDRLFANIGIRADYFDLNKNLNFSPRFSCSYSFTDGGIIKLAWGHYYQSPMYNEFKYKAARSDNTKNQQAIHYVAGIRQKILNLFEFKIEYYYKDYHNLIPYDSRNGYKLSTQQNDAIGFAKGIDLQLKYNFSKISGWLSYGFMIAKENVVTDDRGCFPRATEQRHSLAAIADWTITDKWRIYGKYLYGSGLPYTPMVFDTDSRKFSAAAINSAYLPSYKRFDLRISTTFSLTWCKCEFYLEGINLFNNKNVFSYGNYGIDEFGNTTKEAKKLLPCVPNAGFKILL